MTIMFPLVLVPAYEASNGDANIFYGVTAAILAGAVAGDHCSPISDTTSKNIPGFIPPRRAVAEPILS